MYLILLVVFASVTAVFLAFTIGANDAANSVSTSVGSRAISLKRALRYGAVFEVLGTLTMGGFVSGTLQRKIVSPDLYVDDPMEFVIGMAASLLAAGVVLLLATLFSMPVSTTQTIVGCIVGFGVVSKGTSSVKAQTLINIVISWFLTPIIGAVLGYGVYYIIDRYILAHDDAVARSNRYFPVTAAATSAVLVGFVLISQASALGWPVYITPIGMVISVLIVYILVYRYRDRILALHISDLVDDDGGGGGGGDASNNNNSGNGGSQHQHQHHQSEEVRQLQAEKPYLFLVVVTMCAVAFAHGGNDVSNAISPYAIIVQYQVHNDLGKRDTPYWILLVGGVGIAAGLLVLGGRVVATLGEKLTHLTWARGFAAQLSAAVTVMISSLLGLPVSTTSTLVGAITGVSYVRDRRVLEAVHIHVRDRRDVQITTAEETQALAPRTTDSNIQVSSSTSSSTRGGGGDDDDDDDGDELVGEQINARAAGVNRVLLAKIVASWFVTVFVGGVASIICFEILMAMR